MKRIHFLQAGGSLPAPQPLDAKPTTNSTRARWPSTPGPSEGLAPRGARGARPPGAGANEQEPKLISVAATGARVVAGPDSSWERRWEEGGGAFKTLPVECFLLLPSMLLLLLSLLLLLLLLLLLSLLLLCRRCCKPSAPIAPRAAARQQSWSTYSAPPTRPACRRSPPTPLH